MYSQAWTCNLRVTVEAVYDSALTQATTSLLCLYLSKHSQASVLNDTPVNQGGTSLTILFLSACVRAQVAVCSDCCAL